MSRFPCPHCANPWRTPKPLPPIDVIVWREDNCTMCGERITSRSGGFY